MHIFHNRHARKDARQLKCSPDPQAEDFIGRCIRNRLFTETHLPTIDPFITCHNIKQGSFSRSIGSNQARNGAGFHADGTCVQRINAPK